MSDQDREIGTQDTLWFSSDEQAQRFAEALEAAGHTFERVFDDDFTFENWWRYGVAYLAPLVTHFSQTAYSAAGRRASRFQRD